MAMTDADAIAMLEGAYKAALRDYEKATKGSRVEAAIGVRMYDIAAAIDWYKGDYKGELPLPVGVCVQVQWAVRDAWRFA